jgi:protein SCO1/2
MLQLSFFSRPTRWWVVTVITLLLLGCSKEPFQHRDITGSITQPDFKLVDHNGKETTLSDFKGKVVVIFFGFTNCPDICPTSLDEWKRAFETLGKAEKEVQMLLITVDPKRDTSEKLKTYVSAFNPNFLGLTGKPDELKQVLSQYKAFAEESQNSGSGGVAHTAASYIIDKNGQVRVYVVHDGSIEKLTHDLKILL